MTVSFETHGAHPIISAAGDRPELTGWYGHVPFPTPEQLAAKRAELLTRIQADKAAAAPAPLPVRTRRVASKEAA